MSFAEQMREQTTKTYTENGAAARNTSGDARLDLFASIGSLRSADPERIELLFAEAYRADPLFALKILFYVRDIREGLGERCVFRILLQYLAKYHPQDVIANLDLIGVYGRFDDWYCLVGTRVENEMWKAMKQQLEADLKNFREGKSVSLLAKWIGLQLQKNRPFPAEIHRRAGSKNVRRKVGGDRIPGGFRKSYDDLPERIPET